MHKLIIDNHTKHLAALLSSFSTKPVLSSDALNTFINKAEFKSLILSSGSTVPMVLRHFDQYVVERAHYFNNNSSVARYLSWLWIHRENIWRYLVGTSRETYWCNIVNDF